MLSAPQPKMKADEFIDYDEAHPYHELIDGEAQSLVKINDNKVYRPDVMVTCLDPLRYRSRLGDALVNPTLICEVLSENTTNSDRGSKFNDYRQSVGSLNEYLLVNPFEIAIEYRWLDNEGAWRSLDMKPHGHFTLVHLGIQLAISDIYRDPSLAVPMPANS